MTKKLALMFGVSLITAIGLGFSLGNAGGHVTGGIMTNADSHDWQPMGDSGLAQAVLWGDPATGAFGRLIRLPAGFEAPTHWHTGDYHVVLVAGIWRHSFRDGDTDSQDLNVGSYVFQPAGGYHGDLCVGPDDCILFQIQDVAADFNPVE